MMKKAIETAILARYSSLSRSAYSSGVASMLIRAIAGGEGCQIGDRIGQAED